jgi:Uma2 family endonuclease
MTTVMPDRDHGLLDVVHSIHDDLELPAGYRAEIIGGQISVAASPFGMHAFIVAEIRRAVQGGLPTGYGLFENITAQEPEGDRYIPDLGAWPQELIRTPTQWVFPAGSCVLAVEVTSPGQEERDYAKAAGYARSGTRVYLIVDQKARQCAVHSEPENGVYQEIHVAAFGKDATLPLDTPVIVDTSRF